jgi:hypothetical protein
MKSKAKSKVIAPVKTLYICMFSDDLHQILHEEEYPVNNQEEIDWANKNIDRLELQCLMNRPAKWAVYMSDEKKFEWPVVEVKKR